MQFFEPSNLIFLISVPSAILLFIYGNLERRRRIASLGNSAFLEARLMPEYSSGKGRTVSVLIVLALTFSVLGLARPQWGEEKKKLERKGVDLIFLLDTSLSMLAEDVKPNRLEKSKMEIRSMIQRLKGDRVGMVAFAGSGFLQCPLTLDYSAFLLFVDSINTGYIPTPGTSLGEAIHLGLRAFPEESRKYRAMIVFSDGEDHEGGIKEALDVARKAGVRIYTLGTGTSEGEPIPLRSREGGKAISGYKKDREGQVVMTRLSGDLLTEIARETGGLYFQATAGEREIDLILKHLESLGERRLKEQLFTEREDHFQLFLLIAFLLLIGEGCLGNKKSLRAAAPLFPLVCLFLLTGMIDSSSSLVEKGNRLVKEKKYQSAVEHYRKAQIKRPQESVVRYNLGTALYELHDYREAGRELEQAFSLAKDPPTQAKAHYNYGNAQYRLGNFDQAIEAYKKTLDLDPKDRDAKYNLEFLQKKKAHFEQKQQQNQQQQQNSQPQPQNQRPQESQSQSQPEQNKEGGGQEQPKPEQGQEDKEKQSTGSSGERPDEQSQGQEREESKSGEKKEGEQQETAETQHSEEPKDQEQEREKGEGSEEPKQEQGPGGQAEPLQGQMSKENALRVLEALQDGEKKLHDLRRPPAESGSPKKVLKDW